MNNLIFFYGDECPHCIKMELLIDKLEKEGVTIEKLEVWNNEENMKKLEDMDKEPCGGVPFFINTKTNKTICGEGTIDEIRSWAKGE